MSMPHGTFSRQDIAVSLEESPGFSRGEDVNVGPRLSEVSCYLSYLRPITDSNRIPSYQASANEPESNWHFLSPCDGCALLVARADLGRWHSTTGSSVPDFPLAGSHGLSAHQCVSSLKL